MEPIELLRQLADDPSEIVNEEGEVLFTRQGKDYALKLINNPGVGLTVIKDTEQVPLLIYIQKNILDLPTLSRQIARLVRSKIEDKEKRPSPYIETPSIFTDKSNISEWQETSLLLRERIVKPIPFVTQIIQLMAVAGQGKTALLDELSASLARDYQPDLNPTSILLTVDLLGRYVGSIDDAIAGTLNNTVLFTGLSQKDIILCVKNNWISLALDGFDELVARVGMRDAFSKFSDLVDQLDSKGTVIISARESFFELNQIDAAIQTYMKPVKGDYSTCSVKLDLWSSKQGIQLFKNYGSAKPEEEYNKLKEEFAQDTYFLNNPFFLTRIAKQWVKGERFESIKGVEGNLARIKYILEIYITRETDEKWTGRGVKPIINAEMHNYLLSCIAEDMWKSGNYKLSADEISIATQIALLSTTLDEATQDEIIRRMPTHAAFANINNYYSFLHEQFFSFYLGLRIAYTLANKMWDDITKIIVERDLSRLIYKWVGFNLIKTEEVVFDDIVKGLDKLKNELQDSVSRINLSSLLLCVISLYKPQTLIVLKNHNFSGECFKGLKIENVRFENCDFWNISLSESLLSECSMVNCNIGSFVIDETSKIVNVSIDNALPKLLYYQDSEIYSPTEIESLLSSFGFSIVKPVDSVVENLEPRVNENVIKMVEKLIKWSNKYNNIEEHEVITALRGDVKDIIKIGLQEGVFKSVVKDSSGQKKFFRIICDKSKLIKGQIMITDDQHINNFWDKLSDNYPS